ncbi:putative microsomal signal peptidase 12kDa subunit [Medicago truncatula]|uniref:Microsomal signal peptidase 12 kDa protein n=1 Tax=Medicago truncatula TaxID=3880 RepID=A0A072V0P5_MEDTR|nr:signal peptidase complex-like protein DTM1 isoform X1 [Medicago truncatula]KEH34933.1 microsomal signal peptidase 12 kDa protein [Medicago truncatula]RHN68618.1 putative microsomal signal peptidase 12kDa subunit [Medicago truncatula]
MANDAALRTSILWLAAVILVVGICTYSFKKMFVTYVLGLVGISGVLLPDWDYFNRDVSRWPYPVTVEERSAASLSHGSVFLKFTCSPLRVIVYSVVYGYSIYKWWKYVSG